MRKPKNAQASKAAILAAATEEFAQRGYEGARIDAIANNTDTTRAMVYYYFNSREDLYAAVLESAYQGIRDREITLDLGHLEAQTAVRALVESTFDYYQDNPNAVKIVVVENQAGGRFIRKMARMKGINRSIIQILKEVLDRGAREGTLRRGLDAVDLHMLIASLGFFQIANRHTFGAVFERNFAARAVKARHRNLVVETIMRFVTNSDRVQTPARSATPRAKRVVADTPRSSTD